MNKKLQNEQHEFTKNLEWTNVLQKSTMFLLQKDSQLLLQKGNQFLLQKDNQSLLQKGNQFLLQKGSQFLLQKGNLFLLLQWHRCVFLVKLDYKSWIRKALDCDYG